MKMFMISVVSVLIALVLVVAWSTANCPVGICPDRALGDHRAPRRSKQGAVAPLFRSFAIMAAELWCQRTARYSLQHGGVPREKQEKTDSDLKKDGLMKNEFGKFVSKKRFGAVKTRSFMKWFRVRLAESLHERDSSAVGRFPFGGKVGEEKKEKKAEDMEMHTLGVEVGGMQLEEEIEEPVETCFEGFTCV
eukprot:CAMPEP_0183499336 /NCGR_PEP_ID=MMETSP0371-20130417/1585_1 /TAXON_ID=268820 /ORGANISM="Peridinium aciculiferum, Strain PAER-2" /LENGTH=191 /DNA_ID=CAMNT_0025693119 /DNA_START=172 /DNA_END=744 /DNA_ORIENTATION=+